MRKSYPRLSVFIRGQLQTPIATKWVRFLPPSNPNKPRHFAQKNGFVLNVLSLPARWYHEMVSRHPGRGLPLMWIVRLALRRPYTFVVMAVLIAILGGASIANMPVDIFPYIDIPIVSVVWQYNGLSPEEMEKRIVTNFERGLTSSVSDIEHIESQSYNAISVVRVFFIPTSRSIWPWHR